MEHEKRVDELISRLDLLIERIEVEGSVPELLCVDPSALDSIIEDMR